MLHKASMVRQSDIFLIIPGNSEPDNIILAYGFLNPSNKSSGVLAAWIIGIGVAGVIIFLITRTLCLIRTVLVNRYSTRSRSTDEENVTVEALDEWEAIDIDRPNPRSSNGRKSNDASRENGTSIEVGSSEDEKRRT